MQMMNSLPTRPLPTRVSTGLKAPRQLGLRFGAKPTTDEKSAPSETKKPGPLARLVFGVTNWVKSFTSGLWADLKLIFSRASAKKEEAASSPVEPETKHAPETPDDAHGEDACCVEGEDAKKDRDDDCCQ